MAELERIENNAQLSRFYLRAMSAHNSQSLIDDYKKIADKIAGASVNIVQHYEDNGSLKDLKVTGIGAKTKEVLTKLLSAESPSTVVREIADERLRAFQDSLDTSFRNR